MKGLFLSVPVLICSLWYKPVFADQAPNDTQNITYLCSDTEEVQGAHTTVSVLGVSYQLCTPNKQLACPSGYKVELYGQEQLGVTVDAAREGQACTLQACCEEDISSKPAEAAATSTTLPIALDSGGIPFLNLKNFANKNTNVEVEISCIRSEQVFVASLSVHIPVPTLITLDSKIIFLPVAEAPKNFSEYDFLLADYIANEKLGCFVRVTALNEGPLPKAEVIYPKPN